MRVPFSTLTKQRFIEDAHALTVYLREPIHQEQNLCLWRFVDKHSGRLAGQEYPDLFLAYIGNGQMVNVIEDDVMGYELAAPIFGRTRAMRKWRKLSSGNGPPPYTGEECWVSSRLPGCVERLYALPSLRQ